MEAFTSGRETYDAFSDYRDEGLAVRADDPAGATTPPRPHILPPMGGQSVAPVPAPR